MLLQDSARHRLCRHAPRTRAVNNDVGVSASRDSFVESAISKDCTGDVPALEFRLGSSVDKQCICPFPQDEALSKADSLHGWLSYQPRSILCIREIPLGPSGRIWHDCQAVHCDEDYPLETCPLFGCVHRLTLFSLRGETGVNRTRFPVLRRGGLGQGITQNSDLRFIWLDDPHTRTSKPCTVRRQVSVSQCACHYASERSQRCSHPAGTAVPV